MKKITVAKSAGFCFGVDRAVRMASEAAPCRTLGPLIHNRFAVAELESAGVRAIDGLDELPDGMTLVIRSHGGPRALFEELERKNIRVADATCPFVRKIHDIVSAESAAGRFILIFGDENHPEVRATAGWCGDCAVFADEKNLYQLLEKFPFLTQNPVCAVSQTTARRDLWEKCAEVLKKVCTNAKILDTICNATNARQREAFSLSHTADAMVVVGDPGSANTRSLADICAGPVFTAECARDLAGLPLAGYDHVGVTAGASTPSAIIEEVVSQMSEELKNEAVAIPDEESFADMLEHSLKTLTTGDKVTGIVTAISPTEIHVDLQTKHAAYIPVDELSFDDNVKLEDVVKIGDEIETYVVRVNDVEGTAMLSKKRLDTVRSWEDVESARESHAILSGTVVEENKGGVVVSVKGVRVFVPASQTGVAKDVPLSTMLKTKVNLRITEFNRARRRVVGSIRAVQQETRRAAAEAIWETVVPGNKYSGTVKSLTSYGAFVDIGGVDGLVHLTELSWSRVKAPSDIVKVGDSLDVHVISVDKENKKISLGHRKPEDNPWNRFVTTHSVGDTVSVQIVKLMPFGAFAEIMPNVDGLIHISQITDRRIGKPADAVAEGDTLDVRITEIDIDRKRISLSARALIEQAKDEVSVEDGPDEIVATSDADNTVVAGDFDAEAEAEVAEEAVVEAVVEEAVEEAAVEEAVAEVTAEEAPADAE